MNYLVPAYLLPYVLGGTLAIAGAVLFGLYRALRLAKWLDRDRMQGFAIVTALLVAWLAAALLPSWFGFYRAALSGIPTIQYGLLIPILVGIILFRRWHMLRRVIEAVPQQWIVGVQLYRTLGLIFLVLYAQGRMPGAFAWPAGVGDIIVGLAAPVVGIAYAHRSRNAAGWVRAWNLFGIADLIVALTTGFLTSPSRLQLLALNAPNELVTAFPLVMIPVFLVPLSILLHLASLQKVRRPVNALPHAGLAALRA
jgi:hypothetical protein